MAWQKKKNWKTRSNVVGQFHLIDEKVLLK